MTDSSRVDSLYSFTPSHAISGFTGTNFSYSGTPTYSFIRSTQKDVTVNSSSPTSHQIVNDVATSAEVFGQRIKTRVSHSFFIERVNVTSAGMTAGDIHGLTMAIDNSTSRAGFMRLSFKSTTATVLDDQNVDLTGFTEVFYRNTDFINGDNFFQFYQPFNWDGTSNLIVELSFTNTTTDAPSLFKGEATYRDPVIGFFIKRICRIQRSAIGY